MHSFQDHLFGNRWESENQKERENGETKVTTNAAQARETLNYLPLLQCRSKSLLTLFEPTCEKSHLQMLFGS